MSVPQRHPTAAPPLGSVWLLEGSKEDRLYVAAKEYRTKSKKSRKITHKHTHTKKKTKPKNKTTSTINSAFDSRLNMDT